MIIIQQQANLFSKIIGEQEIKIHKKYRVLNFCIQVKCESGTLFFNNLTKELLLLSETETKALKSANFQVSSDFIVTLIKKWFLVSEEHDDVKLSLQVTQLAKHFTPKTKLRLYNIVTTTACNARCFYCFEAGVVAKSMTAKTASDVSKFILKNYNGKDVKINWFGGEPLCNVKVIDIISEILHNNNINYRSAMTTNGYLFNDDMLLRAVNLWNLKTVQITLDGMRDTYNRVKNYINGVEDPFSQVINNVKKILKNDISVIIRLNVDEYNINEIYELVNYLNTLYGGSNGFTIYAHILFEQTGHIKTIKTEDQRELITSEFLSLKTYIEELGLWTKTASLSNNIKTTFCLADNENGVLISPEGKTGRCERHVDDEFDGDIYTNPTINTWNEYWSPINKCEFCALFPSCLRLKKCPNCEQECFKYEREVQLHDLEKQIIARYKKYLNN